MSAGWQPKNRVAGVLATMAQKADLDNEFQAEGAGNSGLPEPHDTAKEFKKRLKSQLTLRGMSKESVAQEGAAVSGKKTEDLLTYLTHLINTGASSPDKIRKPEEFAVICSVLGWDSPSMAWEAQPNGSPTQETKPHSDLRQTILFKLDDALCGPKASFLVDAVDFAYTAAITSKKNY